MCLYSHAPHQTLDTPPKAPPSPPHKTHHTNPPTHLTAESDDEPSPHAVEKITQKEPHAQHNPPKTYYRPDDYLHLREKVHIMHPTAYISSPWKIEKTLWKR